MSANHHFVPQFYLRHFSENGKSIQLHNLERKKTVLTASIKGQCQRLNFYGRDDAGEKALADLEGYVAQLVRQMTESSKVFPSFSFEHIHLVFYIATQYARTLDAETSINEYTDKFYKSIIKPTLPRDGLQPEDLDKVKVVRKNAIFEVMATYMLAYPLMLDLKQVLLLNKTDTGFITSDAPVVFYNQYLEERKPFSNTGIQSVGLQVIFPLNPKSCLVLFDGGTYGTGRRQRDTVELPSANDVRQLNELQVLSTSANVYFHRQHNTTADVEKLCEATAPKRRTERSVISVQEEVPEKENQIKRLMGYSQEDIRNGLNLTAFKILKSALARKPELLKLKDKVPVRDKALLMHFEKFRELTKKGLVGPGDFMEYMARQSKPEPRAATEVLYVFKNPITRQ